MQQTGDMPRLIQGALDWLVYATNPISLRHLHFRCSARDEQNAKTDISTSDPWLAHAQGLGLAEEHEADWRMTMQRQSSSSPKQYLEKYRALLDQRRRELQTRLRAIEYDFEQPRNPDDDDRATERNNDEVLGELGEAGQKELLAIQAALDRIEAGTFGTCVKCGTPIGEQRLEAVPHTPFCQSCAHSI